MPDEQIIKALEYCNTDVRESTCPKCAFYKKHRCSTLMLNAISDLIDRQKAEIEKLKVELKQKNPYEEYGNCVAIGDSLVFTHTLNDYDKLIKDIGAEAIKEFAKLIIGKSRNGVIRTADIPNLVKEMMEVQE